MDTIQDSAFGQLVRFITKDKFFKYVEETSEFQCPCGYDADSNSVEGSQPEVGGDSSGSIIVISNTRKEEGDYAATPDLEKARVIGTENPSYHDHILSQDLEAALQRTTSQAIKPEKTADDKILVDWSTTGMLPRLYLRWKCWLLQMIHKSQKLVVWEETLRLIPDLIRFPVNFDPANLTTSISIYSFAVYFGSSVYSPASGCVMEDFGVGNVAATLGLALYVLACMQKYKFFIATCSYSIRWNWSYALFALE